MYPTEPHQRPFLPHIKTYETSDSFSSIFESVIADKQGRETVTKIDDQGNLKKYEYIWRQVWFCLSFQKQSRRCARKQFLQGNICNSTLFLVKVDAIMVAFL